MSKTNREQFEAWLVSEYYWANDTLNCANFIGDDETGYYIGGDYIYDGGSCGEPLFWAWRGWQASKTKSEAQLTALTTQLESVVAENAAVKSKGREVLKEAAYVYSHYNRMVDHLDGESVDGQTLHEFQEVIESETPATDAFLAEVRAQGVDDFCNLLGSYAKVEPERFNPQFADLYAKIVNRIFSEVMDNPEVYDLATMSDWLERESENSRAYADMSIRHHDQIRQGGAE